MGGGWPYDSCVTPILSCSEVRMDRNLGECMQNSIKNFDHKCGWPRNPPSRLSILSGILCSLLLISKCVTVEGLMGIGPNPNLPNPTAPPLGGGGVAVSAFAVVAPQVHRHGRRPSARSPLRGCASPEALSQPKPQAKRLDMFPGFAESKCMSL